MIGLVRSGLIGSYAQVQPDTIEVFYRGRLLRFPNNGLEAGQTLCLVKPGDDDHAVPRRYGIPTNTTISPMMVALDQGLARVRQAELLLLRGQTNAAEGLLVDARRYSKLFSQERHHHEALFAH